MRFRSTTVALFVLMAMAAMAAGCGMEDDAATGESTTADESNNKGGAQDQTNLPAAPSNYGYDASSSGSRSQDAGMAYAPPLDEAEQPPPGEPEPPEPEPEWAFFQLSPDDSTSMATAQILKSDDSFWGFSLKAHEVLNYYDPPEELRSPDMLPNQWTTEDSLTVGMDGERVEGEEGDSLDLLIHLYAPQVAEAERRPWVIHLCVDVSGSMEGEKMLFTRDALDLLADAMRPGDRVSLTTFETNGRRIFPTLDFSENEQTIRGELSRLRALGSTNMIDGLNIAYDEAQAAYDPEAINRVIVFSDGDANVGDTSIASFASLTRINNKEGIYLSGVGVGAGYAIERMNALTDAGKGAHVFLPNADEVGKIFGAMVRKLVEVAADEVSVELLLPPSFAIDMGSYSGEEVSTDPNARVPNVVLAAGDDMTILASFDTDDPAAFDQEMVLTVRYRPLSTGERAVFQQRLNIADLLAGPGPLMERTRLINEYSHWACHEPGYTVDPQDLLQRVNGFTPSDPGLAEIGAQIQRRLGH